MDWTQTLTIIISMIAIMGAAVFYLNNKIDGVKDCLNNRIDSLHESLNNKIDGLGKELNLVKMEVLWIKFRLDPNEHPKWNHVEPKEIE